MKKRKIVALSYLVTCWIFFYLNAGEGYLGWFSGISLALTLPWSFLLAYPYAWALIHDGARSLVILLIPISIFNAYLIAKTPRWLRRFLDSFRSTEGK